MAPTENETPVSPVQLTFELYGLVLEVGVVVPEMPVELEVPVFAGATPFLHAGKTMTANVKVQARLCNFIKPLCI